MLSDANESIDVVVSIEVDDQEIVGRILERAKIEGREDDTEDVVKNRLSVYRDQTEPLKAYYQGLNVLAEVDGMGTIDDVFERIKEVLSKVEL